MHKEGGGLPKTENVAYVLCTFPFLINMVFYKLKEMGNFVIKNVKINLKIKTFQMCLFKDDHFAMANSVKPKEHVHAIKLF